MTDSRDRQRKHTAILAVVAVGMFGFAYGLVPLYEVFCELTGINGRTFEGAVATPEASDAIDREVTIQFLAHVGRGMPWEFRPTESRLRVRIGEVNETLFYARNYANQTVTGQAVPSISPGFAATSLRKIECFCFTQQVLEAGEEVEMPVRFYIDEDLPSEVGTLSLSYTLYPVSVAKPSIATADHPTGEHPTGEHR